MSILDIEAIKINNKVEINDKLREKEDNFTPTFSGGRDSTIHDIKEKKMYLLTDSIKVTDVHIFCNDNEIFYIKEGYMKIKIPDCNENHDYYEFYFDTDTCNITIKDI